METAQKESLMNLFISLKKQVSTSLTYGICGSIDNCLVSGGYSLLGFSYLGPEVKRLFRLWPGYSGNIMFPIPGGVIRLITRDHPPVPFGLVLRENLGTAF